MNKEQIDKIKQDYKTPLRLQDDLIIDRKDHYVLVGFDELESHELLIQLVVDLLNERLGDNEEVKTYLNEESGQVLVEYEDYQKLEAENKDLGKRVSTQSKLLNEAAKEIHILNQYGWKWCKDELPEPTCDHIIRSLDWAISVWAWWDGKNWIDHTDGEIIKNVTQWYNGPEPMEEGE